MNIMEYSSGFTKEKWSENDIYIVNELLLQGYEKKEILEKVIDGNLFQLRSPLSIKNRFNMVYNRANSLDKVMQMCFINGSDYDRKALTLYSFLRVYRLPMEFFIEVIILKYEQSEMLYRNDFHDIFADKANISERVKKWRPLTVKRLIRALIMFYSEAGLIEKIDSTKYVIKPIHLGKELKKYAEENAPYLYSFSVLEEVNEW